MDDPTITIRSLRTVEEYQRAEMLQKACWEMEDEIEIVPAHLLITAQKNGGLVLGAFEGEQMVGFLFGFLGLTGESVLKHCSHMMGVLPPYRGQGVGVALKGRQREVVLGQGIELITWTYDPLERPNATLNIGKLGAICRTYLRNVYGELQDELNRGLPTDRFQVEWWLRTDRVATRLAGGAAAPPTDLLANSSSQVANESRLDGRGLPVPLGWEGGLQGRVLVEIPFSIQRVKAQDLELARAWRMHSRELFESYFAAGYTVVDFLTLKQQEPPRSFYVLEEVLPE